MVIALLYREIERVMDLSSAQWDLGVLDLLDEELLSCPGCVRFDDIRYLFTVQSREDDWMVADYVVGDSLA